MLFKLLKLFGLDVAAEIETAKAKLEQRIERTTDSVKHAAQDAGVIAALGVLAAVTATMALIVGLIALYRFTAQAYGDYAGLGADAALLVVMTAAFVAIVFAKAQKLWSPKAPKAPQATTGSLTRREDTTRVLVAVPKAPEDDQYFVPTRAPAAARDLIDPLALVLSEIVQVPTLGNPVVDDLLAKVRSTAQGSADEAVYRAAEVIRHGRPADLVLVLTGTAALAWLITRNARPRP
jgi:plasmid stabilization system protein ParE